MGRGAERRALEGRIRRNLGRHLRLNGYIRLPNGGLAPPAQTKEVVRTLHSAQRRERLREAAQFIGATWPQLSKFLAAGNDIVPQRVSPRLQLVKPGTVESSLFRLATLTWRVPVSSGYGRRMRYLVWDENNWKLMGVFALGDPVFNQRARDSYVGWTPTDRKERLVDVMDAYVMGSLPPYNVLLGGKVVSCLVRTAEVKREFVRKYRTSRGIISGTRKKAQLVLVTTSSALGRSSVYDRLRVGGTAYFEPVGFTEGWGHFHVPYRLFGQMRAYLELRGHRYSENHKFGDGSNWRLRATRAALSMVGWNPDLLRHGVRREVYICKLASNAEEVLLGRAQRAFYRDLLPAKEVAALTVGRWLHPRAIRRPEFADWKLEQTKSLLDFRRDGSASLARAWKLPDSPMTAVSVPRMTPRHVPAPAPPNRAIVTTSAGSAAQQWPEG